MNGEELGVAARVGAVLERLDVDWLIGGSIASSVYGVPRATNDVDLVAALRLAHVEPFVAGLGDNFYVSAQAVREAVLRARSFNVIDDETVTKVDVFIAPPGSTAARELTRRVWLTFDEPEASLRLPFASPADIVVEKLAWFDSGGRTSERQWQDVVGVLRVAAQSIDSALLRELSAERGLLDLLAAAQTEALR